MSDYLASSTVINCTCLGEDLSVNDQIKTDYNYLMHIF
jgi:hypothetical protein